LSSFLSSTFLTFLILETYMFNIHTSSTRIAITLWN
jgi:hypothetical protein